MVFGKELEYTLAGKDVFESFYEMSKLDEFLDRVESRVEKKIPQEIEYYIIESRFNNFLINASF
ncbi:hypothetical protein [Aliivibrio fischeri]|uniref:hypothetical protein n=1 Tax=Aliivibrio fischeri TaxID=668 RepID=UPI0012DA689B|nr:hypothetical protein [Aliivibrio fischeri]MUJ24126.1 hypothetical protein [Aliivibrio fischeri]